METISGLDFAYLDRSILKSLGIEVFTLIDIFRGGGAGLVIKDGRRSFVKRFSFGSQEVYLKFYRTYALSRRIGSFWRAAPALRAFRNARRLAALGIGTAPAVAVVARDRNSATGESGLFTLSLLPAESITQFFMDKLSNPGAEEERRVVLRELACFLSDIHGRGIYPKDCKDANVLVRREDDGYSFHLLDYDSFLFLDSVSARRRMKNLHQMGITLGQVLSQEERLLMLQWYRQASPSLKLDVERLGVEIERGVKVRQQRRQRWRRLHANRD
jgi:hypothetical protein